MLCEKQYCTGCSACYNVCSVSAIKMKKDVYGFLYPEIDKQICVECGQCSKVCPILNSPKTAKNEVVYAACVEDEKLRLESTSGGVATLFAFQILKEGGIVYGAVFNEELVLEHRAIKQARKLTGFKGTKYVQSDVSESFKEIKEFLILGKKVLFVGAPCQVAGLINYLKSDFKNLVTVSFVCGGVPSIQFLHDEINNIYSDNDITNVHFRKNSEYGMRLEAKGKIVLSQKRWHSNFFRGFDEHIIQRESCYNCQYATKDRIGDITIGDFWGLNNSTKFCIEEKDKGVSLVIPSTEKGMRFFKQCNCLYIEEHTLDEACKENPRLLSPVIKNDKVEKFRQAYLLNGFKSAVNKEVGTKYRIYIFKSYLKKNKVLLFIYRKIQNMVEKNNEH